MEEFIVAAALGGVLALGRFKVTAIVTLCMVFLLIGVITLTGGPFVAMAGAQVGYFIGTLIVAMATS